MVSRKPDRSHKSKQKQKKKPVTRILGSGFVERKKKPATHGKKVKSRTIRIDADFAEWLREQAVLGRRGKSVTEVSRQVYQFIKGD